jgi:hypothetical protein
LPSYTEMLIFSKSHAEPQGWSGAQHMLSRHGALACSSAPQNKSPSMWTSAVTIQSLPPACSQLTPTPRSSLQG